MPKYEITVIAIRNEKEISAVLVVEKDTLEEARADALKAIKAFNPGQECRLAHAIGDRRGK